MSARAPMGSSNRPARRFVGEFAGLHRSPTCPLPTGLLNHKRALSFDPVVSNCTVLLLRADTDWLSSCDFAGVECACSFVSACSFTKRSIWSITWFR